MSREIKFKAWLPDLKQIGMVTNLGGSNTEYKFFRATVETRDTHGRQVFYTTSDFVLLAFTGLNDKNGKEIWEGDIVKCVTRGQIKFPHCGPVVFVETGAYFALSVPEEEAPDAVTPLMMNMDFEVIGNIYEHPELLKP